MHDNVPRHMLPLGRDGKELPPALPGVIDPLVVDVERLESFRLSSGVIDGIVTSTAAANRFAGRMPVLPESYFQPGEALDDAILRHKREAQGDMS